MADPTEFIGPKALIDLGDLLEHGLIKFAEGDVEYISTPHPDHAEAANCYQTAAGMGDTEAMYRLGDLFKKGFEAISPSQPNYAEATKWYQQAADNGNIVAIYKLKQLQDLLNKKSAKLIIPGFKQFKQSRQGASSVDVGKEAVKIEMPKPIEKPSTGR